MWARQDLNLHIRGTRFYGPLGYPIAQLALGVIAGERSRAEGVTVPYAASTPQPPYAARELNPDSRFVGPLLFR